MAATPAAATAMSAGPGRISAGRPCRRGLLRGFYRQHVRIDPEHAFGPRKGVEEPREQVRPDLARVQCGRRLLAAAADEFPDGGDLGIEVRPRRAARDLLQPGFGCRGVRKDLGIAGQLRHLGARGLALVELLETVALRWRPGFPWDLPELGSANG